MADAYVAVAPDSTGKKVQTFENTVGGQTVEAQAVSLVDTTGAPIGTAAKPLQTQDPDVSATGTITAQDTASTVTVTNPTATLSHNVITGTATAGSIVSLATSGESSFSGQITGTWTGTLQVERSVDGGSTWTDVGVYVAGAPGTTKTFVANSAFHGNSSAAAAVRLRATSAMTGTANIVLRTGSGTGTVTLATPVGVKDATNSTQQLGITAKGTQAAFGVGVQDLKDSGRTSVVLNASGIATVATIALVTMQSYKAGTVATGITDYTVTTGKTLRLQKCVVTMRPTTPSTTATFASCTFALRRAANTAVTTTASLVLTLTGSVATNAPSTIMEFDVPDGLEFAATDHIGFTQVGTTGGTFDLTLIGFEY